MAARIPKRYLALDPADRETYPPGGARTPRPLAAIPDRRFGAAAMVSTRGTIAPTLNVEGVQGWVRPRPIDGISALLLPYRSDARPDWTSYADSLERTIAAGL